MAFVLNVEVEDVVFFNAHLKLGFQPILVVFVVIVAVVVFTKYML